MPSINTTTPILGSKYYHLFNRGTNRQNLFFSPPNYLYFLKLLDANLSGFVEFLAYALLPNHFHIILKVKDELDLETVLSKEILKNRSLLEERFSMLNLKEDNVIGSLVVKQLKRLFITYSMAINKQEKRVGNLFSPKYKRLEITNEDHLKYAIFYTHYNPEKHGIVKDFKTYKYSSFRALNASSQTKINRDYVFDLFGGKSSFLNYHEIMHEERETIIIE